MLPPMSRETHLLAMKIERSLGSLCDFFLLYFYIKLFDLLRLHYGKAPHRKVYWVMYLSIALTQLLFLARGYVECFYVEAMVMSLQLVLGAYVALKNVRLVISLLRGLPVLEREVS